MVYMCSVHAYIVCIQELHKGSDSSSNQKVLQLTSENDSLNSENKMLKNELEQLRRQKEKLITAHCKNRNRSVSESEIDYQVQYICYSM